MSSPIKDDFYARWITADGLALLGAGDPPNDNGILFLALFLMLCQKQNLLDELDITRSFNAIKSIEVAPGLYCRRPNDTRMEAHDNYVGVCAISVIFSFVFARNIAEYGLSHGYNFNNTAPDTFEMRSLHQGGDVAFYSLSAGYIPAMWDHLWLCIGLLIAGFKGTPSVVNLAWLRIQAIALSIEKKGFLPASHWATVSFFFVSLVYNIAIRVRFGGIQGSFLRYFRPEHPINLLAKGV